MRDAVAFTVFVTAIGECALAWSPTGLVGAWLPEHPGSRLRGRIRRRWPQAIEAEPDPSVSATTAAIIASLEGHPVAFAGVRLDDAAHDAFDRRVWAAAREIPHGRVVTYADLARRIGPEATPRAVGQALGRNPFPMVVPCHRIVATGGTLGGFSAPGGTSTKRRLLTIENARLDGPADLFDPDADEAAASSTTSA